MSKKGKFVDICTLEDLTALVNHNFSPLPQLWAFTPWRRRTGSGRNRSTSFRSV